MNGDKIEIVENPKLGKVRNAEANVILLAIGVIVGALIIPAILIAILISLIPAEEKRGQLLRGRIMVGILLVGITSLLYVSESINPLADYLTSTITIIRDLVGYRSSNESMATLLITLLPVSITAGAWLALGLALRSHNEDLKQKELINPPQLPLVLVAPLVAAWKYLNTQAAETSVNLEKYGIKESFQRFLEHTTSHQPADASTYRLGVDLDTGEELCLSDTQHGAHTVVCGATGSGKTTTLRIMAREHIQRGLPLIVIDLKGSPDFTQVLREEANIATRRLGREVPFHLFSLAKPEEGMNWNPVSDKPNRELVNMLLALETWGVGGAQYYKRLAAEHLTWIALLTHYADEENTLQSVAGLCRDIPELMRMADAYLPSEYMLDWQRYVAQLLPTGRSNQTPKMFENVQSYASRIGSLVAPGSALVQRPGVPQIDLNKTLAEGGVVVFSLQALGLSEEAAQIGALAILDLISSAGRRIDTTDGLIARLLIDEAAALDGEHVTRLFAQARASRIQIVLATQELADFKRMGAHVEGAIMGNTSTKIVHRQELPESAERFARMIGTRQTTRTTDHVRKDKWGQDTKQSSTLSEHQEYYQHPDVLKTLEVGQAVVLSKVPVFRQALIKVDDPRLQRKEEK
jgi:hypothetical protein